MTIGDAITGADPGVGVPVPLEAVDGVADRSDGVCSTGERNVENGDSTEPKHVGVGVGNGQAASSHESTPLGDPLGDNAAVAAGTSPGQSRGKSSGTSQHDGGIDDHDSVTSCVDRFSPQGGGVEDPKEEEKARQHDVHSDGGYGSDGRVKEAEAAAKAAWGITPGRLTMLVGTLLKEADEWGEDVKHLR